jgi:PKD repeat protein
VLAGSSITLNGSASQDADGDLRSYNWVLSTGGTMVSSATLSTATYDYQFDTPGTYTVELRVTDWRGSTSSPATKTIIVE